MSTNFQPPPEDFEDVSAHLGDAGQQNIVIDNQDMNDVEGHVADSMDDPADPTDDVDAHVFPDQDEFNGPGPSVIDEAR
jgi:hypothetical protein